MCCTLNSLEKGRLISQSTLFCVECEIIDGIFNVQIIETKVIKMLLPFDIIIDGQGDLAPILARCEGHLRGKTGFQSKFEGINHRNSNHKNGFKPKPFFGTDTIEKSCVCSQDELRFFYFDRVHKLYIYIRYVSYYRDSDIGFRNDSPPQSLSLSLY